MQCRYSLEDMDYLYDLRTYRGGSREVAVMVGHFERGYRKINALGVGRIYNISTKFFFQALINSNTVFFVIRQPMCAKTTPLAVTTSRGVFQDGMPVCNASFRKSCA